MPSVTAGRQRLYVRDMTEFPPGFFDRADETSDAIFYAPDRLVRHLDGAATAAVGRLYRELDIAGDVLDLCSSWVSA